ncbi:MAG: hypothetical protein B7C24_17520 [Bacteroidetes bacterium 4572_77]|nr:MAG: hypothetical protein B7C24_17520 [Bacteroidetes bacterium 4572_77]
MIGLLNECLEKELLLLQTIIDLSEEQQQILVKFDLKAIETITVRIENAMLKLNEWSQKRIEIVANKLQIEQYEAKKLSFSDYQTYFGLEDKDDLIKKSYAEKTKKMYSINSVNRMLANRASHSIKDMVSIMMSGNNNACNVKI